MFKQIVIWLGTIVGTDSINEFESYFLKELGFKVKYLSEFKLNNENKNNCVLFYIHTDDIPKFAMFRLTTMDMKWFEDFVENNMDEGIIPDDIMKLYRDYMKS